MKKILLFLFLVGLTATVEANTYKSLYFNYTYYYSKNLSIEMNDIVPFKVKDDSVMVIVINDKDGGFIHPRLYSKNTSAYLFDIVVSKELADLVRNEVEEYKDDLSGLVVYTDVVAYKEHLELARKEFPNGYVRYWGWSSNGIGGLEPYFSYMNTNKKTIKYLTFYVSFYNAVGDICRNEINGNTLAVCKCVGPIKFGEKASYSWENSPVFYNSVAHEAKIKKIVIQYMDNSKAVLINNIKYEHE